MDTELLKAILTGKPYTLHGWDNDWGTAGSTVKAKLFGILVQLCEGKVQEYHGDLYHDVHWLDHYVTGPTSFRFMVRPSGTHIGSMVDTALEIGTVGDVYSLTLTCNKGRWSVTIKVVTPADHKL